MRSLLASPQRLSILGALLIAALGYFFLIGSAQAAIAQKEDTIASCHGQIESARVTIAHASDIVRLSQAVLQEINGVDQAPNETVLIKTVWDEAQRIANENHVVLTSLRHEKVRALDVVATRAATQNVTAQQQCLPVAEEVSLKAAVPAPTGQANQTNAYGTGSQGAGAPSQGARGAAAGPTNENLVHVDILPVVGEMRGSYINVIRAIAAFSQARVLLQYDSSKFQVQEGRNHEVAATFTLLAYPPLKVDSIGRPVGRFNALTTELFSAPAPVAASSPNGGQPK